MGKRKVFGFTLTELIVVIAIIAVLASVIAPAAFRAIEKAKISRAVGDMKAIRTAAMSYYTDTGNWPIRGVDNSTRALGKGFLTNDDGYNNPVPGWDGPYLEKWPRNPWGNTSSGFTNQYYWDASNSGDDNNNGLVGEAQVIMFNVLRKSALTLDRTYDDGVLIAGGGASLGMIYQNQVVSGSSTTVSPVTINWVVYEPLVG